MRFKVTVELEEGVKAIVNRRLSSELVIMCSAGITKETLEQKFKDECAIAAKRAAHQIYSILSKEGIVIEYEDPITKEKKYHKVENVNEIPMEVLKAKGFVV